MPSCRVYPSVRLPVRLSRSCILSKRINISSIFSHSDSHTIRFFSVPNVFFTIARVCSHIQCVALALITNRQETFSLITAAIICYCYYCVFFSCLSVSGCGTLHIHTRSAETFVTYKSRLKTDHVHGQLRHLTFQRHHIAVLRIRLRYTLGRGANLFYITLHCKKEYL